MTAPSSQQVNLQTLTLSAEYMKVKISRTKSAPGGKHPNPTPTPTPMPPMHAVVTVHRGKPLAVPPD